MQPREVQVRIDLHVHTARHSACAECAEPGGIAECARRAGLHAVVLADHDLLWRPEERDELQALHPETRLLRGIECSTSAGHLLVIGLDDAGALRGGGDLDFVVRRAHAQGAAVILAHPYRDGAPDALDLSGVDAVEVGSTSFTREAAARAAQLARRWGKPGVAGSDAHALSRIGWAWTVFPRLPRDEKDLAEMIRQGQGRPVIPNPFAR